MRLADGLLNRTYRIDSIHTSEEGMKEFLFTLGCFPGQDITVISHLSSNYIINVKDARYTIDDSLAEAISLSDEEAAKHVV